MKTGVIITGIKQIDKKLMRLPPVAQKKVARKAMRDGIKVIAAEVKDQVPVDRGITRANVKVRAVKTRKRGSIEIEVRIAADPQLVKIGAGGKRVFYPAVVEYGDQDTAANPFMRRSYESKGESARQVTMAAIVRGIEEAAARS